MILNDPRSDAIPVLILEKTYFLFSQHPNKAHIFIVSSKISNSAQIKLRIYPMYFVTPETLNIFKIFDMWACCEFDPALSFLCYSSSIYSIRSCSFLAFSKNRQSATNLSSVDFPYTNSFQRKIEDFYDTVGDQKEHI